MAKLIVKRGSIVLIRYPFTDSSGTKVRPALILSPDILLKRLSDVLCLFISSSLPQQKELLPTDFILEKDHPSFVKTGLKSRSVFRSHKIALLDKSLVLRGLGEMDRSLMDEIDKRLCIAIGLKDYTEARGKTDGTMV
jgi:mRNA interferase MazF